MVPVLLGGHGRKVVKIMLDVPSAVVERWEIINGDDCAWPFRPHGLDLPADEEPHCPPPQPNNGAPTQFRQTRLLFTEVVPDQILYFLAPVTFLSIPCCQTTHKFRRLVIRFKRWLRGWFEDFELGDEPGGGQPVRGKDQTKFGRINHRPKHFSCRVANSQVRQYPDD